MVNIDIFCLLQALQALYQVKTQIHHYPKKQCKISAFIFDLFDITLEYLRVTSLYLLHSQSISQHIYVFQRVTLKCYFYFLYFNSESVYLSSINRMCISKTFEK